MKELSDLLELWNRLGPKQKDLVKQDRDVVAAAELAVSGKRPVWSARDRETIEHIEQFFAFKHLPAPLAEVSQHFARLAFWILTRLPRNPERAVALRKLLESKDAAVRAKLAKDILPDMIDQRLFLDGSE